MNTTDSPILYAFLVTVFGFLISLSAALIAGLRHRSRHQSEVDAAKVQHMFVAHHEVFFGGGDPQYIRQLGRQQFRSNCAAVLNFEADLMVPREPKPRGRFATFMIDHKSERLYGRLHPCVAR